MIHRLPHRAFAFLIVLLTTTMLHAQAQPYDYDTWRQFWSFKPVTQPQPPHVQDKQWVRNPIDNFILARLESQGLKPAPQADKHTLIRRATFDLIGLPPTLAEIEAFINDTSPEAYEKLITRLLASPHYGERYGRHWLDVVRYEQGKVKLPGIKNTRGELDFRDYIIRSFNSDKPYDQLLTEHLAGDLLPVPEDRQQYFDQLTATAFLSIGNWFDECTDPNRLKLDIIDEQINAVSKAFLGLTVSCARCHDHKFDPITERDYYALAGIFASTRIIDVFSENWKDGRVRLTREKVMPTEMMTRQKMRSDLNALRDSLLAERVQAFKAISEKMQRIADEPKLLDAVRQTVKVRMFEAEQFAGQSNLRIVTLNDGERDIEVIEAQTPGDQWVKYELNVDAEGTYTIEVLHTADEDTAFSVQVGGVTAIANAKLPDTLRPAWAHRRWSTLGAIKLREGVNTLRIAPAAKDGVFPRIDRVRWYRQSEEWNAKVDVAAKQLDLPREVVHALALDLTFADATPAMLSIETMRAQGGNHVSELLDAMDKLSSRITPAERLITVSDQEQPTNLPVHLGGDTYRVSKTSVPRAVPVLFENAVTPPTMPAHQSGRLELAKWLVHPNHPLTSRVMVNRLWLYHFGHGIVDSPNDLGSRGSAPSHPQLLDWLAATFTEQKWSMKKMHYLIMTSATYRQEAKRESVKAEKREIRTLESTANCPELVRTTKATVASKSEIDLTQNSELRTRNFFSPFPRRRLEVEAIYDAMLATTGKVPRQPSDEPLDFNRSADRMMYVLTSNRSPVGLGGEIRKMFAVFDYDPTGEPMGQRDRSTTAAQSLYWLNSSIPKHFAGEFAKLILRDKRLSDEELLRRAYLMALGKEPDEAMATLLLDYLKNSEKQGESRVESWTEICLALYASSEFRYLD